MDLNDISQEEFERIEAYIIGKLSSDDLREFELKLKNEPGFKTKVEDIKTVLAGIETQVMKEQLNVFHEDIEMHSVTPKTESKVHSINWKKLAIAAVFLIAAGGFWFYRGNTNDRLYAEYFSPDPGLPTTMSSTDNYEFYEAMVNYKQGNYKTAISKWKTLQEARPNNDTLNYFIGVAHLANKNEKNAISFLEDASKNSEFALVNDANYYLGLAHLKSGDIEKAKVSLQNSTSDNSKALLSELND
jgi:TolA-binding protein